MLLKNMMKEGLEPNHQTYAGLLEACGNMMDASKVENVLMEMELKVKYSQQSCQFSSFNILLKFYYYVKIQKDFCIFFLSKDVFSRYEGA